jgi:hypothetical protein
VSGSATAKTRAQRRIEFAEKHILTSALEPFDPHRDHWLINEFWRALDGYKLWPVDASTLCDDCRPLAGELTDSYWDHEETRSEAHAEAAGGCQGLQANVIWLVLLRLSRQEGKTTGAAAFTQSELADVGWDSSIALISGSEDQSEGIVERNFSVPIQSSNYISRRVDTGRTKLVGLRTRSTFVLYPTSMAGVTSGSHTLLIIDEARAVEGRIAMKLIPTINARNGWRCPYGGKGHTRTIGDMEDPGHKETCDTCGSRLEPWVGKVVCMSNAQEIDGSGRDWFHESVELAKSEPGPNIHVYEAIGSQSRSVSKTVVEGSAAFFGKLPSTADYIEIETSNVSRRKGDPFVTSAQIQQVTDRGLKNNEGGTRPAVGFLDTSISGDLTSLVICEGDYDGTDDPWRTLEVVRLDIWDPAKQKGGLIDEHEIYAHCNALLPNFGLLAFRVDTRMMPWAINMVRVMKREASYRGVVDGVTWRETERAMSWAKLEERILGLQLRIPDDRRLISELKTARKFQNPSGRLDVREPNRKRKHLDVAESLAACCFLAHELALKGGRLRPSDTVGRGSDPREVGRRILQTARSRSNGRTRAPRRGSEWY